MESDPVPGAGTINISQGVELYIILYRATRTEYDGFGLYPSSDTAQNPILLLSISPIPRICVSVYIYIYMGWRREFNPRVIIRSWPRAIHYLLLFSNFRTWSNRRADRIYFSLWPRANRLGRMLLYNYPTRLCVPVFALSESVWLQVNVTPRRKVFTTADISPRWVRS